MGRESKSSEGGSWVQGIANRSAEQPLNLEEYDNIPCPKPPASRQRLALHPRLCGAGGGTSKLPPGEEALGQDAVGVRAGEVSLGLQRQQNSVMVMV